MSLEDIEKMEALRPIQKAYSETKTQASALAYQMTHDHLTGLPNRTMLYDRLLQALLDEGSAAMKPRVII